MELEWQRPNARMGLALVEIQGILAASGIVPVEAYLIEEGLANTNYRVVAGDGSAYLLRILQRDPASRDLEVALATRLDREIPIPRLVFQNEAANAMLLEWKPGRTMQVLLAEGRTGDVLNAAEDLGRTLAKIASHTFPKAGFLIPALEVADAWPSVYEGLFGYLDFLLAQERLQSRMPASTREEIKRAAEKYEADIREASQTPCLSHGDYKPSNLLIENGRLSGVLDWEFAHSGTWLLDAGQLMRYLGPLRNEFRAKVEVGLRQGGLNPPSDWPEMARVIDFVSLVDFLNREGVGERMIQDVTTLIHESLSTV